MLSVMPLPREWFHDARRCAPFSGRSAPSLSTTAVDSRRRRGRSCCFFPAISHHSYFQKFSGLFAWLLWSVVHVFLLIGFRNRLAVMWQWVWAYLTRAGSSPLITEYQQTHSQATPTEHAPTPAGSKGAAVTKQ